MAQVYNPWADPEEEDNVPGGLLTPFYMEPSIEPAEIELPAEEEIMEPEPEMPEPEAEPTAMHMQMMETMQKQTAIIDKLLTLLTGKE